MNVQRIPLLHGKETKIWCAYSKHRLNETGHSLEHPTICYNGVDRKMFTIYADQECVTKLTSYFSNKSYAVGTQNNGLNDTVLLSTQNIC